MRQVLVSDEFGEECVAGTRIAVLEDRQCKRSVAKYSGGRKLVPAENKEYDAPREEI